MQPNSTPEHVMSDHRDPPQAVTPESILKAQQGAEAERVANGLPVSPHALRFPDVDRVGLGLALVTTRPLLPRRDPEKDAIDCSEAIDIAVERWGVSEVVRCLRYVLSANGIDYAQQSLDDLAEGMERV